jgi:hypothetical protein
MGGDASRRDQLLALGLAARREGSERRVRLDRRSGVDRRKARIAVSYDRRSGGERRQLVRRKIDQEEGPTLLQKARSRLGGRLHLPSGSRDHPDDGLR